MMELRSNVDILGTVSTGINLLASSRILAASSCPALLKICMTLPRLMRIFSKRASLRLIASGSLLGRLERAMPSAMPSSIAWAPPWPWSLRVSRDDRKVKRKGELELTGKHGVSGIAY